MTTEVELALLNQRLEDLDARLSQMDSRAQVAVLRVELEEAYVTAQNAMALANSLAGRVAALEAGSVYDHTIASAMETHLRLKADRG
jgi:hypothetical protein